MKQYLRMFAVLMLLGLPGVVWAQPTWIPPEMNWSPTPSTRSTPDTAQLTELLVQKGLITPQEAAQLRPFQGAPVTGQNPESVQQSGVEFHTTP